MGKLRLREKKNVDLRKQLRAVLDRSLHSLIQHVCILQASVTIHSMHSVVLGALGRYMVIENSVLFGQGKHYKAMPSTQSQCNIKTSTGMPYMYRHYKWLRWKFYELFPLEIVLWLKYKMFLFHFIVLCIIQNMASNIISILGGKTKKIWRK